jgi:hypothetical protein
VDADQEQAVRLAVQLLDTGDANTVGIEVLFDVWVRLEPLWLSSTPLPTVLDVINLREPNPIDIADCADLYGRIGEAIVARGSIGLLRKPILAQSARALDFQEFANQSDPDSLIAFGMLALKVGSRFTATAPARISTQGIRRDEGVEAVMADLVAIKSDSRDGNLIGVHQRARRVLARTHMLVGNDTFLDVLSARCDDDDYTGLNALGRFLLYCKRPKDALEYFDRADREAPDESRAEARLQLIECAIAAGVPPPRRMAEIVKQWFREILDWKEQAEGFLSPDELWAIPSEWEMGQAEQGFEAESSAPHRRDLEYEEDPEFRPISGRSIEHMVAEILARSEQMLVEQQQTRTDIGAVRGDLRRFMARDGFYAERICDLLPAARRNKATSEMKRSIKCWSDLPESVQRMLVGASYLATDAQLSSGDGAVAVVMSAAVALELFAREQLPLGRGADIATAARVLDRAGAPNASANVAEINDLRNTAAHGLRALQRADIDRLWNLLLGDKTTPSVFDIVREQGKRIRR